MKKDSNRVVLTVFERIENNVRENMKLCRLKNSFIYARGISKHQTFETILNNYHVFRNLRNIDFALSCMDILATNAQISNY